jgi:hypothetical protein
LFGESEQITFMQLFTQLKYPASYSKHISFLDFDQFQLHQKSRDFASIIEDKNYVYRKPVYVNMVREPVNRIVSWYYYIRAPWYILERNENGTMGKLLRYKA